MQTLPTRTRCYRFFGGSDLPVAAAVEYSDLRKLLVTTAGAPTVKASGGKLVLALAANDEVEVACAYMGDDLAFAVNRLIRVEMVVETDSILTAVQQVIFGMSTARNNDPDALAASALFRIDGDAASNKIKTETDDGVNDVAPVDSGQVLPINTPMRFCINFADNVHSQAWPARNLGRGSNIKFYGHNSNSRKFNYNEKTHFRLDGYSSGAGLLQPIVQLKKASGTGVPKVKVTEIVIEDQLPV